MPVYESNTRKIVRRLEREGWANTTLDAGLLYLRVIDDRQRLLAPRAGLDDARASDDDIERLPGVGRCLGMHRAGRASQG